LLLGNMRPASLILAIDTIFLLDAGHSGSPFSH
jgi:hypothetical protein